VAALARGGGGGGGGRRRAQTAPRSGAYMALMSGPAAGGARYGAASSCAGASGGAALPPGAAPVVVARSGAASTGLSFAVATAAGVVNATSAAAAGSPYGQPTAPPALVAGAAALAALGYTGRLPLFNGTSYQCRVPSDCPVLDACTAPVCLPGAGSPAPTGTAVSGCCGYVARGGGSGACASPAAVLPEGATPAPFAYVVLPAAAAGALPLPPPPRGYANGVFAGAGLFVDPTDRNPTRSPNLNVWDARSAWWGVGSAFLLNSTTLPGGEPYLFQSSSTVDDRVRGRGRALVGRVRAHVVHECQRLRARRQCAPLQWLLWLRRVWLL
jgi:hypothetical protein